MQEILWQIFNKGEVNSKVILARVPFLEAATNPHVVHVQPDIKTMSSPRLLKTHLIYDAIPKGATEDTKCKYIYIARNPKDVVVSYFKFASGRSSFNGYNGPWEFFAKLFVEGNGKFVTFTIVDYMGLHREGLIGGGGGGAITGH